VSTICARVCVCVCVCLKFPCWNKILHLHYLYTVCHVKSTTSAVPCKGTIHRIMKNFQITVSVPYENVMFRRLCFSEWQYMLAAPSVHFDTILQRINDEEKCKYTSCGTVPRHTKCHGTHSATAHTMPRYKQCHGTHRKSFQPLL
jgi:hypothetical protein